MSCIDLHEAIMEFYEKWMRKPKTIVVSAGLFYCLIRQDDWRRFFSNSDGQDYFEGIPIRISNWISDAESKDTLYYFKPREPKNTNLIVENVPTYWNF